MSEDGVTITITPKHLERLQSRHVFLARDRGFREDWSLGWLKPGDHYTFRRPIRLEPFCGLWGGRYQPDPWIPPSGLCTMGALSYSHAPLPQELQVGRYCSIAKGLQVLEFHHPLDWVSTSVFAFYPQGRTPNFLRELAEADLGRTPYPPLEYDHRRGRDYPIIGNDVWIGQNVTLALGITIGNGSVVAANSVVTRDVPDYAVVAGNPARVRKMRFSEALIAELLELRWWEFAFTDFRGLDLRDPAGFCNDLRQRIAVERLERWNPTALELPGDFLDLGPSPAAPAK